MADNKMKETGADRFRRLFTDGNTVSKTLIAIRERQKTKELRRASSYIAIDVLMAMESKGMAKGDLAKQLDITIEFVNELVQGKMDIPLSLIIKLEKELGLNLLNVMRDE